MREGVTLAKACELLMIEADTSRRDVYIECPVCGKKKKMNLNFQKNLFNCPACNTHGNSIQFWSLMRGIPNLHEASKDYFEYTSQIYKNPSSKKDFEKRNKAQTFVETPIAPIKERDKVYRALLDKLSLYQFHKNELIHERCLSEDAIKRGLYKSYPQGGVKKIVATLLNEGYVLENVPGFFKDISGTWTLAGEDYYSGILIPIMNGNGQIQSIQIRADKGDVRYFYLSSGDKPYGTPAQATIHLAKGTVKKIILTEGPLKANIISHLTGWYCLAIPGVNSIKNLPEAIAGIKEHNFSEIYIAFDMDLYENSHVYAALCRIKECLSQQNISFYTLDWDKTQKGLDDYLISIKYDINKNI